MDHFKYSNGTLQCEGTEAAAIAEELGTPTYVYSKAAFTDHFRSISDAFAPLRPKVCYSIKSCHNLHILRLLRGLGAAFDAVSAGEVRRALEAGANPQDIVFAGVGKTEAEMAFAIERNVGCFNVETPTELETLSRLATEFNREVRAALRVNPDVDAGTHPYTTTGKDENKFGIEMGQARELYAQYAHHPLLKLAGVHLHIGSPVNSAEPYVEMITKALTLIDELLAKNIYINLLNIGGGYGADYEGGESPTAAQYADAIIPLVKDRGLAIIMEPGRSISANAGILICRTTSVKQTKTKSFVITDGAMTDLIRPALYQAYHFAWPVAPGEAFTPPHRGKSLRLDGTSLVDIVGPVCESSDFLGKDRWLPPINKGDLIAVFSAGAYGAVMSSQYNSRPRAAEVLVDGESVQLIRRRETYDDLVAAEREV